MSPPQLKRVLSLTDVVLFNVTVIFSLRGMATGAKMGPASILLWLLAIGAFFVPVGLVVAEMATRDPAEGGFYRWTRRAFGDAHGFICAWFYWVTNLTYLPSLLFFLAANLVFVVARPGLGDDPWFVVPLALGVLWFTAWLNIRGLSLGKRVTNGGAAASWIAAVLLIAAGITAFLRFGSATPWHWSEVSRSLGDVRTVAYFGTLSFALVGLEFAPVMGDEIKEPRRVLPRALLISGAMIAVLYILGTSAILVAVPPAEVSPISGGLGAVQAVAGHAGWRWLPVLTAVLVSFSVLGGVGAWLGGMARIPYAAGLDRFLPPSLATLHPKYGTPHVSIVVQTALTSVLIVASQAGSTVREAYLILLDMTITMNFIPFLYIFLAAARLRRPDDGPEVARIPGGRIGLRLVTTLGLSATILTMVTSVIPPSDVANPALFEAKLWGGLAFFSAAGYVLFRRFSRTAANGLAEKNSITTS
ncbi:MAG: APC family permease [Gemmatimonadales bacterium]|nr:APC family permease [Gemmatimonadales bacterium]